MSVHSNERERNGRWLDAGGPHVYYPTQPQGPGNPACGRPLSGIFGAVCCGCANYTDNREPAVQNIGSRYIAPKKLGGFLFSILFCVFNLSKGCTIAPTTNYDKKIYIFFRSSQKTDTENQSLRILVSNIWSVNDIGKMKLESN